jgi:Domain of unknown function (DUF4265)
VNAVIVQKAIQCQSSELIILNVDYVMNKIDNVKIHFTLNQDEDGYPPVKTESLWSRKINNNLYAIDNIPFFVFNISYGDIICATNDFIFTEIIEKSKHSTFRVFLMAIDKKQELLNIVSGASCGIEYLESFDIFAIDIPPDVNLQEVRRILNDGEEKSWWQHEESSVR